MESTKVSPSPTWYKRSLMIVAMLLSVSLFALTAQTPCTVGSGVLGGKIFGDYNLNGIDDQASVGVAGVEVVLFGTDSTGNSEELATVQTDTNGDYFFDGLVDGTSYRIEFVIPNNMDLYPGFIGANSQSSVQFVTAPSCDVDLGLANPNDFCVENPKVVVPCYVNGDPLTMGTTAYERDAIVAFSFDGQTPYTPIADAGEVGATFGVVATRSESTVYASALLKRHVGLGPLGLGGIYKITDADNASAIVSPLVDVASIGINVGSIPSNVARGLPIDEVLPSLDTEAYFKIGKAGIGGLAISDDESTLWFVNLFEKTIHSLVIDADNNPTTPPTAADVMTFALPNANCTNGEYRPFGIHFYRDKIYVGGVCDASSGTADDLIATIHEMPVGSSAFTEVLRFDLNYEKGKALRSCDDARGWFPWRDELPDDCTGNGDYVYPSPILSSMAFDVDGSLVMGFMDRTGNQLGFLNYGPQGNVVDVKTTTGGDILRAANINGTFVLESNGMAGNLTTAGANNNEGPGGGEFYYQDVFTNNLPPVLYPHNETSQGGIAIPPGSGVVMTTALDPIGTTVNAGGVNFLSNTTGEARNPGYLLFNSGSSNAPTFGKANGLGGVAVLCGKASLEIGNYVWHDANNNGVQDPDEQPLTGINITLLDASGNELATVQTDANGYYVFNNNTPGLGILEENTDYTIVVGTGGQFNAGTGYLNDNYVLTTPNTGVGANSDLNDSDGIIAQSGTYMGYPSVNITTGGAGENNHDYDFGFVFDDNPTLGTGDISGRVFKDCNNNGIREVGEFPIENVSIHLSGMDDNGVAVSLNQTTNASGNYQFLDVSIGVYTLTFENLDGLVFTPQDQGSDDTIDSDVDVNTGSTNTITLTADASIENVDAGYNDIEAPVLSAYPMDLTLLCLDDLPQAMTLTAMDNCDGAIEVQYSSTSIGNGCNEVISRTWSATDICGNQEVHTQTIVFSDDESPVLSSMPVDVTVLCGNYPSVPQITATDNCSTDIEVVFTETPNGMGCEGGITRRWSATDACGNSVVHEQVLMTSDDEAPVLSSMPADVTVSCGNYPSVPQITATDNCSTDIEVVFTETPNGMECEGGITRRWSATDACGNSVVHEQVLMTSDNEAPVFSSEPQDITVDCIAPNAPTIEATDACVGSVQVQFIENSVGDDCDKTVMRTWTATDNCGNSNVHTQVIRVIDNEAPVITPNNPYLNGVPNGGTVYLECDDTPAFGPSDVLVTDNCDTDVYVIFQDYEIAQGVCAVDGYSYILTCGWTATDACGNSSTYIVEMKIVDTTPPAFENVPSDVTIECVGEIPAVQTPTVSDNCTENLTITLNEEQIGSGCAYEIKRTWSATDMCGNVGTAVQTIFYGDYESPMFTSLPPDRTIECDDLIPTDNATAEDNCGAVTITHTDMTKAGSQVCENTYTLERIWRAEDVCGNVSTHIQTIEVVDSTPPNIQFVNSSWMNGQIIQADCTDIPVYAEDDVQAIDNCDADVEITLSDISMSGTCETTGYFKQYEYTWTATDNCGNTASLMITLQVTDLTAPVFENEPEDVTVDCTNIPEVEGVSATDNCGGDVEVAFEEAQGDENCLGSHNIIRTWTASDACGNTNITTQYIIIEDNDAPRLDGVPSEDIILSCGASVPQPTDFTVTASDNCDTDVLVEVETVTVGVENCVSGGADEIEYVFTATDDCGNTVSESVRILFEADNIPPVLSNLPPSQTINCDDIADTTSPTATDNCDMDVQITFETDMIDGDCANGAEVIRTWIATDNCGNTATATQTITIIDTEAPDFGFESLPDITVECNEVTGFEAIPAQDNCSGEILGMPVTDSFEVGSCERTGVMIVVWTATDACGNAATVSQQITIIDTTPPVFDAPPVDITVECHDLPAATDLSVSDNCTGIVDVVLEETESNIICANSYSLQRRWTATDDCGNVVTHIQNIEVMDTTAPVFETMPEDVVVECDAIPETFMPIVSDNCSPSTDVSITPHEEIIEETCAHSYTLQRTWTATDACGNQSTIAQTIEIEDNTAPSMLNIPVDMTVECDAIPSVTDLTVTDNCSNADQIQIDVDENQTNIICENEYTLVRQWTLTDLCGNSETFTQTIVVEDNTMPVIQDTPEPTLNIDLASGEIVPPAANLIATDNCGGLVTVSLEESTANDVCIETIERTWTATDACGNTATFTQVITVTKVLEITANIVDDTCEKEEGSISVEVSGGIPPYTYLWSNGQSSSSIENLLAGSYTLMVTDAEGCTTNQTFTVAAPTPEDCIACGTTVGNYVWYDLNENGLQDSDELGVENVMVNLIEAGTDGMFNTTDDVVVETDYTDAAGLYEFNCIAPGTYIVQFNPITLPSNTLFTETNTGTDDAIDSDADAVLGQTAPFTLVEGQAENLTLDAGIVYDCVNVTDGGEICCDQVLCGPGSIAETIGSLAPATGGYGTVEYLWMKTTHDIDFDINNILWESIPGATSETYNPGAVYETTYYTRCARSQNCDTYSGETSIVVIEVVSNLNVEIVGVSEICAGETTTFVSNTATVATSYEWTLEGATPSSSSLSTAENVVWTTPGVYEIQLVASNEDCADTTTWQVVVTNCVGSQFAFLSFEADVLANSDIALQWSVENEQNTGVYVIEYSIDGITYTPLQVIEGTVQSAYTFTHDDTRLGQNNYRIKYVDVASNFIAFSADKKIVLNPDEGEVHFYPNPFQDKVQMELLNPRAELGQLQIVDVNGIVLQEMEIAADMKKMEIDLSVYPQGVYFLKLKFGYFKPTTYRMIKAFE